ncbi:hypothetical protein Acr_21g0002360 [Actinidia rufa]|uniref:Reverse transcriptase domain-containing protein n=1 Tax=Actinidia rufa TaxID=165716 RepID=A0A7J0GFP3_9ERIC|nr:hypothetical protein Acr_21g0002360 [Actinidia rufa]
MAAEEELIQAQQQLHDNPANPQLQIAVLDLRSKALKLAEAELSFCSQLAKAKFSRKSDKGTKFFHDLIKSKHSKSSISSITLKDGRRSNSNKQVSDAFVHYYKGLLGSKGDCISLNRDIVSKGKSLDPVQETTLIQAVSEEEIKTALFSIGEDKAHRPDGFFSCFFKKAWDTVGRDFTTTVMEFFSSDQILKQINHFDGLCLAYLSTSYSLSFNGSLHGFFKGKRGLKQVDPLSPYCFVLCLEYLSRSLEELKNNANFNFHPRCGGLNITQLAYADDLVLFPRGDPTSVALFMDKLKHFGDCLGLKINLTKSSFFSAGISGTNLETIKKYNRLFSRFFPFRYLGIPAVDSRLTIA